MEETKLVSSKILIVSSNITHQVLYEENKPLMIISFSPFCSIGLWFKQLLEGSAFLEYDNDFLLQELRFLGNALYNNIISQEKFLSEFDNILNKAIPSASENSLVHIDKRIIHALEIIYHNFDYIIAADKMAEKLNLSTGRFLHLFKKEIGLTYRRMQIWMKLAHSFRIFSKASSLTDLALTCGFSDSAHFSRSFKETFGVSPSILFKNSQFIQ
jgi:AraC-like DNA-binding protein